MKDYKQLLLFLKKYSSLVVITILGFYFIPDVATFTTTIFRLSVISFITLLWLLLIGTVNGWGIFPDLDLKELCNKSTDPTQGSASIGAGLVLFGLLAFLCTVIFTLVH